MNTTTWPTPTLLAALLAVSCLGTEGPGESRVPGDSRVEGDSDTDTDADTDADADTDTQAPTHLTVTIRELQQGLVEPGTLVVIEQVVVVGHQLEGGFHVADPEGGEAWSGLWVSSADQQVAVAEGDLLRIAGSLAELDAGGDGSDGDGTLTALLLDQPWTLLGQGVQTSAALVSPAQLAVPETAEAFEGMLVRVEGVTVSQGGAGSWQLDGSLEVGTLYHSSSTLSDAGFDAVLGVLWYERGRFLLCPRGDGDLVGYDPMLDDCGEAACIDEVGVGGLVVSEVMRDPEAVFDDLGEWLELYNPGERAVDLRGLEVGDDDGDLFTVTESVLLEPGGLAVLAANANPHTNGGLPVDWDYPYASFTLANGIDELVLAHSGVIFDRVGWDDGVTFPNLAGATMALDPDHLDADSNDDGAFWCAASSPYGDGDLGTPGGVNAACIE
jgi:hypothetical protein